ncbi:MAG: hypothetical protein QOE61_5021 [Micromonosporaceae bacterium]|jgi:hypothetical protein|nr:hypothetical protein [Micromonosporaceae bacterium]
MADVELDPAIVDEFLAGTLDAQGEAGLAGVVARVMAFHWRAPNPIQAELSRIIDRVGGEPALFAWLDRYPGEPRLVARLYRVMALLDQLSDNPAVVEALREFRARIQYPPGLRGYLVPSTDETTLASLAGQIELLLADDRTNEAAELAVAALAMLEQIAPRAAQLEPNLRTLGDQLEQARGNVQGATTGSR